MVKNEPIRYINSLTGIPIQPNQEYDLHYGNNLISYPFEVSSPIANAIPDNVESSFSSIIGEGVAATRLPNGQWVGSLTELQKNKAYWVKVNQAVNFNFEQP